MQTRLSHNDADLNRAGETSPEGSAHLLPGPHDAAQLAAMDAAIEAPARSGSVTRTRILVGTAALAVAVTIPDISLGAIAAPYARIDLGEQAPPLPANVWSPAARPAGPAYAPVVAAAEVLPVSLTFSSRANLNAFDRTMPVSILEAGSERFDLAFAGVALPDVETYTIAPITPLAPAALPRRQRPTPPAAILTAPSLVEAAPPPRAHLVAVPQITVSRGFRPEPAPGISFRTGALTPEGAGDTSIAATNTAIEAAFAGAIDASSAVRSSIPVASTPQPARQTSRPETVAPPAVRAPAARAIATRQPEPAASASSAAQAELVVKSRLDARVNGVLTGSVEFRQLDGTISIRLRSVIDILRDRFSASEIERFQSGQAIDSYITLSQLQSAGIPISYNPAYDEVEFGIDYNDAPNAGKVQVEQIGAPTLGGDRVGMDQITQRRR